MCPVAGPSEKAPANNGYKPGFAAKLMLKDLKLAEQAVIVPGIAAWSLGLLVVLAIVVYAVASSGGDDTSLAAGMEEPASVVEADEPALEESVRAKLVKRGGIGYVQPSADTFPPVDDFIAWVRGCEAIPMITWLASNERLKQADPMLTANPRISRCSRMDSPSTKRKETLP